MYEPPGIFRALLGYTLLLIAIAIIYPFAMMEDFYYWSRRKIHGETEDEKNARLRQEWREGRAYE